MKTRIAFKMRVAFFLLTMLLLALAATPVSGTGFNSSRPVLASLSNSLARTLAPGTAGAEAPATTSGWQIITIPGETKQGEYSSIAVDQGGNPHISFMDETDVAVKYVRWDGSSWEAHTIDTLDLYAYPSTSLALNGDGQPQIAYPYNNPTSLHHAEWDGVQWKWSKLSVGTPYYASLALKETGEPCISFLVTRIMGIEMLSRVYCIHRIYLLSSVSIRWRWTARIAPTSVTRVYLPHLEILMDCITPAIVQGPGSQLKLT